jgi:hypothetical protein
MEPDLLAFSTKYVKEQRKKVNSAQTRKVTVYAPAVTRDFAGSTEGISKSILVGTLSAFFARRFQRGFGGNLVCYVPKGRRVGAVAVASGVYPLDIAPQFGTTRFVWGCGWGIFVERDLGWHCRISRLTCKPRLRNTHLIRSHWILESRNIF